LEIGDGVTGKNQKLQSLQLLQSLDQVTKQFLIQLGDGIIGLQDSTGKLPNKMLYPELLELRERNLGFNLNWFPLGIFNLTTSEEFMVDTL